MVTNLEKFQNDLDRLIKLSDDIYKDLSLTVTNEKSPKKDEAKPGSVFFSSYQRWYTEAYEVIRQILPNRLSEFETLYKGNDKRKTIIAQTYTIRDWFLGIHASEDEFSGKKHFDDTAVIFMQFQLQKEILESAKLRFKSSLLDIRQILHADLFDSELDAARELLKNGFLRAAGAVAGVVAEKHLDEICQNHKLSINKKNPTFSTFNDTLKDADIIDTSRWRLNQRLGDLRNLCDHSKDREPTKDEVTELIEGVEKLTKTVF